MLFSTFQEKNLKNLKKVLDKNTLLCYYNYRKREKHHNEKNLKKIQKGVDKFLKICYN